MDAKMVQFECPMIIYPLLALTFGVPLSSAWRKMETACGMLKKVEILFAKIVFVDCKWSNLNAPGSYTPCCYSLLG